jgi:SAM-dependent methyltransferase
MDMIRDHARIDGARALDVGCGVGMYTAHMVQAGGRAVGVELEWARAQTARRGGLAVAIAQGEALPFPDRAFDTVLLHEVLEHVADDRATVREGVRLLVPGGRIVAFVPNRWWPFETHGLVYGGRYRFGNIPLINYLPDAVRNRLAPHVRVYTGHALTALFDDLPVSIVVHTQIYPGYDKLVARRPRIAAALRRVTYALEHTPLRRFGLSHLLVAERRGDA